MNHINHYTINQLSNDKNAIRLLWEHRINLCSRHVSPTLNAVTVISASKGYRDYCRAIKRTSKQLPNLPIFGRETKVA